MATFGCGATKKTSGTDGNDQAFEHAYAALNKAQREAVDAIEGPVMVVAGPGTGKTQILALRIANILRKTDTAPENILALTFTEGGERAMRARLLDLIGPAAYRVSIFTFHGFCERLIRTYPDAYEHVLGGRAVEDVEQVEMLLDILSSGQYKLLVPMGNREFYVGPIRNAISQLKREYITSGDLLSAVESDEQKLKEMDQYHEKGAHKGKERGEYTKLKRHIEKHRELHSVYIAYNALLREKRRYDFDDMIVETIKALESDETMLRDLQEGYHYVLADEHQDVNGSQNKILALLLSYHASPNIFVVGDEKQAIYRFQGASLENFLYFEEQYGDTKTITLTENYRSSQPILDAGHELIEVEAGPLSAMRVPLIAAKEKAKACPEFLQFAHQGLEDDAVVAGVAELIAKEVAPNEIAVILRKNREVEAMASLLRKRGIAATASAEGDILSHPIMYSVTALIDAARVGAHDDVALFAALHEPYWGITVENLARISTLRNRTMPLRAVIADRNQLQNAGVTCIDAVIRAGAILEEARSKLVVSSVYRVLEYLVSESGLLAHVMEYDPVEGGRVLRRIYDEIKALTERGDVKTFDDVTRLIERRRAHNLPLVAPYIQTGTAAVRVMTAHKSKGLEFEHVFVPHLTDAAWGGRARPEYFSLPVLKHLHKEDFDVLDDERRLLYVAMTRAKRSLRLSYAKTNDEGKTFMPSRLIGDIADGLLNKKDVAADDAFDPLAPLRGGTESHGAVISSEFLHRQLLERGLSVTGLNNYLASPWTFFYRNILRIPEVPPLHMLFGTAVHDVLERVAGGASSDVSALLKSALLKLPLSAKESADLHEKGLAALTAYLEDAQYTPPEHTKREFSFRVVLKTGDEVLPEIPLTGVIDRLDLDEKGNAVRFIDYKTGKPKTRGHIEGATKSSNGNEKRQLVFYALLLSLYDDERLITKEGVLAFVEPDSKGKIHEERYVVTDEEIEGLTTEIIRVAKEISSGSFLQESCDPNASEYCAFAIKLLMRGGEGK